MLHDKKSSLFDKKKYSNKKKIYDKKFSFNFSFLICEEIKNKFSKKKTIPLFSFFLSMNLPD